MGRKSLPTIIQGGMGVGVSGWQLARAVSSAGQLGVVSGTAMDLVLARRLQLGDPCGHMRRALAQFPIPGVAKRILDRYFVSGGIPKSSPFRSKPITNQHPSRHLQELLVAGNFVEVLLAREGHDGPVGINFLAKTQTANLPSIYGAMLAGVCFVIVGAGIPRTIPGILDQLARRESVELRLDVLGADCGDAFTTHFDPNEFCNGNAPELTRPDFLAIVSFSTLANMLTRRASGRVDGFVVEGNTAGGHNAPPRGRLQLNDSGEPIYGARDIPDLGAIRELGLPFWLAGSYAEPHRLAEAQRLGAVGIQVGTAFAYCEESGLDPALKERVLAKSRAHQARVFVDPVASPTGFPFRVVQLDGTQSASAVYENRTRICDLGYLRHAYKQPDGALGWRCPGEPVEDYVRKGGKEHDTHGRKCICNGLLANIGLGQVRRDGEEEKPLVTSGDDITNVARFLKPGADSYRAVDVLDYLQA